MKKDSEISAVARLALRIAVEDSMGIYPAAIVRDGVETKRTEWQDGWNAHSIELSERCCDAQEWYRSLPESKRMMIGEMLADDALTIHFDKDGKPRPCFSTSDLFAWGYADFDEATDDILEELHAAWKKGGATGMTVWWCLHVKRRPQMPLEKRWRELGVWDTRLEEYPQSFPEEK